MVEFKRFIAVPNLVLAYQLTEETLIDTLDGCIKCNPGDWIVKDSLGLKRVSDRVFNKCYREIAKEEVEEL